MFFKKLFSILFQWQQQKETKWLKKEYNPFLIFEISHSEPHWVAQFEWIENFLSFSNLTHLNTCPPFLEHWRVPRTYKKQLHSYTSCVYSVVVSVAFSIFRVEEGWTVHYYFMYIEIQGQNTDKLLRSWGNHNISMKNLIFKWNSNLQSSQPGAPEKCPLI